jgi:hypothetical protein
MISSLSDSYYLALIFEINRTNTHLLITKTLEYLNELLKISVNTLLESEVLS